MVQINKLCIWAAALFRQLMSVQLWAEICLKRIWGRNRAGQTKVSTSENAWEEWGRCQKNKRNGVGARRTDEWSEVTLCYWDKITVWWWWMGSVHDTDLHTALPWPGCSLPPGFATAFLSGFCSSVGGTNSTCTETLLRSFGFVKGSLSGSEPTPRPLLSSVSFPIQHGAKMRICNSFLCQVSVSAGPGVSVQSLVSGNGKGASEAQSHWRARPGRGCCVPLHDTGTAGAEIRWNSKRSKPWSLSPILKVEVFSSRGVFLCIL